VTYFPKSRHQSLISSFFSYAQNPEELFEALSQSLLAAVDRDALSGWGAVVHIMYAYTLYMNINPILGTCVFFFLL